MKFPSFLKYCQSNWAAILQAALLMTLICGSCLWYNHLHPHYWTSENNTQVDIAQTAVKDYQMGHYREAEIGFRAATVVEPTRMECWYNLGNACFKQGKYEAAFQAYQRALELDSSDPDIRHNMTLAWRRMTGR
jgi:tetratricopeptide (TPR) repeat protein